MAGSSVLYNLRMCFYWTATFSIRLVTQTSMHGVPQLNLNSDTPSSDLIKVERVILRTFSVYDIKHPVTDHLLATFKTKLWKMDNDYVCAALQREKQF